MIEQKRVFNIENEELAEVCIQVDLIKSWINYYTIVANNP